LVIEILDMMMVFPENESHVFCPDVDIIYFLEFPYSVITGPLISKLYIPIFLKFDLTAYGPTVQHSKLHADPPRNFGRMGGNMDRGYRGGLAKLKGDLLGVSVEFGGLPCSVFEEEVGDGEEGVL
jgi:hypothetical protein